MAWYAFDILSYRADTAHLTTLEHGAYRLLIDHYMLTRLPLPDDDRALANIALMPLAQWKRITHTIRGFFSVRAGRLHQRHCDRELDKQDKAASRRSEHAEKAARARWGNNNELNAPSINGHRVSMPEACPANAQSMLNDATRQDKTTDAYSKKEEGYSTIGENDDLADSVH
jgi:uncharacterized protein YdaU (DUF1376 family)